MQYNEIYCNEGFEDEVTKALEKLALEHPEWGLSDGTWDTVEED